MKHNVQSDFPVITSGYKPNLGYIGSKKVSTSNYLFTMDQNTIHTHAHARQLLQSFLQRSPEEHYLKSEHLTAFIKKRGLTFSKKLENGESRIFTVPVTSSIVPLAKSTFNQLEKNAQSLILSLRWILQSIYGAQHPSESPFIQSLPTDVRELFIKTVLESPQYFKALHHSVMNDYPFMEVVGLDLVLVDEYVRQTENLFSKASSQELPFKLLELNAGSPSGAGNNMNILEGLLEVDPEFSKIKERVLPNDHFDILRATFDSIGKTWTGASDGISVILPPGGANGAAPEIHMLSAYSGIPYVDAEQMYQDSEGNLRLRTISGRDPRITSIYSRVNADSALYNPEQGITMRDAETGEPIYREDPFKTLADGKKAPILNAHGEPIPAESIYTIPHALQMIHQRKLYVGGLNRVLDNKLILSTLTYYGPRFYEMKLAQMGLKTDAYQLQPPETLSPSAESVAIIEKNPDEWVVKAPDLSGGNGVHILLTLPNSKKKKVLNEIRANPTRYNYQKLVKIARIPVTKKEGHQVRFQNLAADMRMWCFFGDGSTFNKPKLTHNGLVRFAPCERGPMSSIVNTSKGGGYAPLLIIDDINSQESISITELTAQRSVIASSMSMPLFVAAQVHQISRQIQEAYFQLSQENCTATPLLALSLELKQQLNEVLSYLSPRNMEPVSEIIRLLEKKTSTRKIKNILSQHTNLRTEVIAELYSQSSHKKIKPTTFKAIQNLLNEMHSFSEKFPFHPEAAALAHQDHTQIEWAHQTGHLSKSLRKKLKNLTKLHLAEALQERPLQEKFKKDIQYWLEVFCDLAYDRLSRTPDLEMAESFKVFKLQKLERIETPYSPLLPLNHEPDSNMPACGTLWEIKNQANLMDSHYVLPELREIRAVWHQVKLQVERLSRNLTQKQAGELLEQKRQQHFEKFPILKKYQSLIEQTHNEDPKNIIDLLEIFPFAKYNVIEYARSKKLSVHELFTKKLQHQRVTLMNHETLTEYGFNPYYAGECFAKKRKEHGLISDSDILTWMSTNASPMIQAYTLGHELIHAHQIEDLIRKEILSLNQGSLAFAQFLNFYGNYLADNSGMLEKIDANTEHKQTVFHQFYDTLETSPHSELLNQLKETYVNDEKNFEQQLKSLGSWLGFFSQQKTSLQVKAGREIIPCLENAKNIHFAKDLGLKIEIDEVRSALPTANKQEVETYRKMIQRASYTPGADPKVLQIIANHQIYGVQAPLEIQAPFKAMSLGTSYNNSQQQ